MTSAKSNNPTSDAVRDQLERILKSPDFAVTDKLKEFLRFVVEETLAGRAGELKAYTIAISVYGRESDFDATYDPLVRIQAGKLRRALERYYLMKGKAVSLRIDIPKGTYVPVFVTNDPVPAAQGDGVHEPRETSWREPKVAVLPFANLTGDPGKDYIASGIAEELAIELTRYENIRVIGCGIGTTPQSDFESGHFIREYGIDFLIEGSLRLADHHLKISLKLLETATGEYLWGDHYQGDLNTADITSIQEKIAGETIACIASEYGIIMQKLSRESRGRKPAEFDIYDAYLRYYYYQSNHSLETFTAAFQALELAIGKDPECGMAKAMLASMHGNMYMMGVETGADNLGEMVKLASEAVKLEPNNQLVRIIYAWIFFVQNKKDVFFSEMEKALELNPNSPFRIGAIGFFLSLYGEWERGKALLDRAIGHNTYVPTWYYGATTLYYYRVNDYQSAYRESLKYDVPSLFWSYLLRAATLGQFGRETEARQQVDQLKKMRPDFENRARELIFRYIKEADLVEHLLQGLHKAGMKVAE